MLFRLIMFLSFTLTASAQDYYPAEMAGSAEEVLSGEDVYQAPGVEDLNSPMVPASAEPTPVAPAPSSPKTPQTQAETRAPEQVQRARKKIKKGHKAGRRAGHRRGHKKHVKKVGKRAHARVTDRKKAYREKPQMNKNGDRGVGANDRD